MSKSPCEKKNKQTRVLLLCKVKARDTGTGKSTYPPGHADVCRSCDRERERKKKTAKGSSNKLLSLLANSHRGNVNIKLKLKSKSQEYPACYKKQHSKYSLQTEVLKSDGDFTEQIASDILFHTIHIKKIVNINCYASQTRSQLTT